MSWVDWVDEFYWELMQRKGWTPQAVDEMDILYYIKLLGKQKQRREQEQTARLDAMGL